MLFIHTVMLTNANADVIFSIPSYLHGPLTTLVDAGLAVRIILLFFRSYFFIYHKIFTVESGSLTFQLRQKYNQKIKTQLGHNFGFQYSWSSDGTRYEKLGDIQYIGFVILLNPSTFFSPLYIVTMTNSGDININITLRAW